MRFFHGEDVVIRRVMADKEIHLINGKYLGTFRDLDGAEYHAVRNGVGIFVAANNQVLKISPPLKVSKA